MSKNKDEFEKKDEKELKKVLAEKHEALRDFRFNMKGSRVRNTKEGSKLRKDIARIMNILGTKKLLEETKVAEKTNTDNK